MAITSTRWKTITQSQYSWEREALEFIKERLPDREPYRAWANFEFIADDGSINEVDLLVLTPQGFFMVEIKSRPGTLTGDSGTWRWENEGRYFTDDNPLILTNRKAKKLVSLLKRQKSSRRIRMPFLEALVFCSDPDLDCKLYGYAKHRVCLRDRKAIGDRPARPGIIAAIEQRKCGGIREHSSNRIDSPLAKAITRAMDQAGIRESQRKRRVSDYILKQVIADGPGYQDWEAAHVSLSKVERRVRIYLVRTTAAEEERHTIERAAAREFQLLESLQHQGVLRADAFTEHEMGPAIVFEHHPTAMRLDHYLAERGQQLGPDHRLYFLRQISEVVHYAHQKRIVHRSLSPHNILVVDPDADFPKIKIFNWQTGYRTNGTSSLTHHVTATDHVDQLVDDQSTAYMAPEALNATYDGGEHLDVFSLGAIAYQLFANQPPAANALELSEKLRIDSGLQISAVLNGAGENLQELIQYSTHPDVSSRLDTVKDFLEFVDAVEDELTTPENQESTIDDPTQAQAGDRLSGGTLVIKRLGTGASSVGFLVEHQGRESILKVALDSEHNDRIRDEAQVLKKLRHPRVVEYYDCFEIGDRSAILMRALTRNLKKKKVVETLRQWIHKEGRLQMEMLHRFGEDLLVAVNHLEEQGVSHRDIKPDNLAVANVGRIDKLHLVLFDFSLSRAPVDNIRVGTRGYLDPFLSLRKHKQWDSHAERWAAAVTLYEMSTGQLPVWHDGKTDPAQIDQEFNLDAELFETELRDGLSRFFRKALRRDPDKRFDNAEQMLRAWRDVFEVLDQQVITSDHVDEIDSAALLETAEKETQIPELGLSTRATNALDRLNVLTVKDLLLVPIRRLYRLRGVGQKTRREITNAVHTLRKRFSEIEAIDTGEKYNQVETDTQESAIENASVDLLADRIITLRKTAANETTQEVISAIVGMDEKLGRWPTQAEIGRYFDISRARVGQVLKSCQERWSRNSLLTRLREDIAVILQSNGGVMMLEEMADAILAARGSVHDNPLRTRLAVALIRSAIEVERTLVDPRYGVRRDAEHIYLFTRDELATYAIELGRVADQIAQEDPLLPPARVMEKVLAVPAPSQDDPMTNSRLIRLAAAASSHAAISSRQELYPVGMPAARALKLAQGALLGAKSLSVNQIRQRVASRYPEAETLPSPPELDRLLKDAGLDMQWDHEANGGKGAFCFPSYDASLTQGSMSTLQRYPTSVIASGDQIPVTPEVADARQFEERLLHNQQSGGFIALSVASKFYQRTIPILQRKFRLKVFDMEKTLIEAIQKISADKNIKWDKIVQADTAAPESRDWQRLLQVVRLAMPVVEKQIASEANHLLIIYAGLLTRYDQMQFIDDMRDRAGQPKSKGGLPSIWMLIPTDDQSPLPLMEGKAVPVITSGQHARIPYCWLRNVHHSSGKRSEKNAKA